MKDLDFCEVCNGLGVVKEKNEEVICEECDGMGVPDDDIYFDKMNSKSNLSYEDKLKKENSKKNKINKKSDKEVGL